VERAEKTSIFKKIFHLPIRKINVGKQLSFFSRRKKGKSSPLQEKEREGKREELREGTARSLIIGGKKKKRGGGEKGGGLSGGKKGGMLREKKKKSTDDGLPSHDGKGGE